MNNRLIHNIGNRREIPQKDSTGHFWVVGYGTNLFSYIHTHTHKHTHSIYTYTFIPSDLIELVFILQMNIYLKIKLFLFFRWNSSLLWVSLGISCFILIFIQALESTQSFFSREKTNFVFIYRDFISQCPCKGGSNLYWGKDAHLPLPWWSRLVTYSSWETPSMCNVQFLQQFDLTICWATSAKMLSLWEET